MNHRAIKATLVAAALLLGNGAMACKQIVVTRLTFAEGSADLASDQVAKLARFIDEANTAFTKYLKVTIDGGASVRVPERPPLAARRLANQRAMNATRAYEQLQPRKLKLETAAEIYADRTGNDFVVVQFHLDYEALNLADCNPVPTPGLRR